MIKFPTLTSHQILQLLCAAQTVTWAEKVTMLNRESLNAAFPSSVPISSRFAEARMPLISSDASTTKVTLRPLSPTSSDCGVATLTSDPMVLHPGQNFADFFFSHPTTGNEIQNKRECCR